MRTAIVLGFLCAVAAFGQASNPLGGMPEAYIEALRLKMEMQKAKAQQDLMDAQAAAIRAKTEQLRLEAERAKPATPPVQPNEQMSPAAALAIDPDFVRLPIAVRVKFVKLVDPHLAQYADDQISLVLRSIEDKVLATQPTPAPTPADKPKPLPGPGGGE